MLVLVLGLVSHSQDGAGLVLGLGSHSQDGAEDAVCGPAQQVAANLSCMRLYGCIHGQTHIYIHLS